jgi:polysaccharide transporter, PST family
MSTNTVEAAETLPPDQLDFAFDQQDLKRRTVQGSVATMGAQAVKFVVRFGSAAVVARFLSPAEYGLVAMVSPILGFISTFNDIGFGQAIVRSPDITRQQVSSLFWRNLIVSIGLALLMAFCSPLVGRFYHEPRTVGIVIALGGMLILSTLTMVPNALLKRRLQYTPLVIADLGSLCVATTVTITLAVTGFGYWALVLGQLASSTTMVIITFSFAKWWPTAFHRGTSVTHHMRFGRNLTVVNLATYFSMTADNMIVGAVAGKTELGLYDRSYTLTVQPLNQLLAPINQVSIPLLSKLHDQPELFRRSYQTMLRLALLATMPAMIWCVLLAEPIIRAMLGPHWTGAAPIFAWVCLGGLLAPIFSSTGWVFTTQDRTAEQMRYSVVSSLIGIASFAAGAHWGAYGVAKCSAIAFLFLQTPLIVFIMTRRGHITRKYLAGTLVPFLIATPVVAAALYFLRNVHKLPAIGGVLLVSYGLFALLLFVLPGGRDLFRTLRNLKSSFRPS